MHGQNHIRFIPLLFSLCTIQVLSSPNYFRKLIFKTESSTSFWATLDIKKFLNCSGCVYDFFSKKIIWDWGYLGKTFLKSFPRIILYFTLLTYSWTGVWKQYTFYTNLTKTLSKHFSKHLCLRTANKRHSNTKVRNMNWMTIACL